MRDGTVLQESNADRRQAPASLTKMMTLYLAFEAVRNGQLSLDQNIRVSRHAASMPASKLYLRAGQKVSVRSLIRAAAIKSANDAAVVLAEAVGGSEQAFARLMTAKAQQLGMSNTTFKNASGLTAPGHLSTARDMATLARRLFFDFPEYYNIFSRTSETAAGKRVYNTNRLLRTYRGADGVKTGYTNAAGYNLVASAHRGNERIIAAVLGGRSSRARNAKVEQLLDLGFRNAPTHTAMVPPAEPKKIAVAAAPLPEARPGVPATGLAAIADALASPAVASVPNSPWAPLFADLPPARPRPAGVTASASGLAPAPEDLLAEEAPVPVARPEWSVKLGSYESKVVAVARLNEVALGDVPSLANAEPVIDRVEGAGGATKYQVRFDGLSPGGATSACEVIKADGRTCAVAEAKS